MPRSPENSARAHLRLIHGGADAAPGDADSATPRVRAADEAEAQSAEREPGAAHMAQRGESADAEARMARLGANESAESRKAQRGAGAEARGSGAPARRRRGARALRRGALAGRGVRAARRGAGAMRRGMGAMRRGVLRLAPAGGEPTSWIGRDFGEPRAQRAPRQRRWPGVLAGLVIAGLLLAGLRMAIVRERYLLGEAIQVETSLRQRERAASVAVRELRDPRRLRRLAVQAGFARPERAIELAPAAKAGGPAAGGNRAAGNGGSPNQGSADDTTGLGRRVEWLGR